MEHTDDELHGILDTMMTLMKAQLEQLADIRKLVEEQAEDGTLWFPLSEGREARLQAALRKLHALAEERRVEIVDD